MNNKRLLTIFLIVFVDLLGFSLILPLLPYYAQTFGSGAFMTGLLVASYALAQLIGAPILGRWSDRVGRRRVLLVSIFGTFIGFLLLGFAGTLWMLFVSRIIDGLTGGNLNVAQAYITDVTDQKNRAKGLGLIGAAFGMGFTIGPAVGGALSVFGFAVPAFAAAALALLNLIAVFFFLPESLTAEDRAALATNKRPPFTFRALWTALSRPRVGPLLHTRFFFGLAFAMFQSIFALYAQFRLNLNAQTTGYVLAYVGVLLVIVQGFAVGKLAAKFSETRIIFAGSITMAMALLAWAFVPDVWTLLVVLVPMSFAGGIMNTVLSSALTKSVYPEEIGGTLGLSGSVESMTRVLAPTLGGTLLQFLGTSAPGIVCSLIMVWVSSFVWLRVVVNPDPPLAARSSGAASFQGASE